MDNKLKKRGTDYATSLIEVVRITQVAEMETSPRYMREPSYQPCNL